MRVQWMCAIVCMEMALLGTGVRAQPNYQAIDLYPLALPNNYSQLRFGSFYPAAPIDTRGETIAIAFVNTRFGPHEHAIRWAPGVSFVDLVPDSPIWGYCYAINGSQVVGIAGVEAFNGAVMWNGDGTIVDLHPTQFKFATSGAIGLGGNQQVGFAGTQFYNYHAMLWTGTAASAVDLQPKNSPVSNTIAVATDGVHQVGYGDVLDFSGNRLTHPLLWSGTADSMIDLMPADVPGVREVRAYGVHGDQQVGEADYPAPPHAILWTGTAESAIDLHPLQFAQFTASVAYATNGFEQVGSMTTSGSQNPITHAVIWFGTAASAVDLQAYLPSGFVSSRAYNIDSAGDVFGIATDGTGLMHATEWTPAEFPEPSSIVLVSLAAIGLLRRSR